MRLAQRRSSAGNTRFSILPALRTRTAHAHGCTALVAEHIDTEELLAAAAAAAWLCAYPRPHFYFKRARHPAASGVHSSPGHRRARRTFRARFHANHTHQCAQQHAEGIQSTVHCTETRLLHLAPRNAAACGVQCTVCVATPVALPCTLLRARPSSPIISTTTRDSCGLACCQHGKRCSTWEQA